MTKLVKYHSLKLEEKKKFVYISYMQREYQDASCDDSGISGNY